MHTDSLPDREEPHTLATMGLVYLCMLLTCFFFLLLRNNYDNPSVPQLIAEDTDRLLRLCFERRKQAKEEEEHGSRLSDWDSSESLLIGDHTVTYIFIRKSIFRLSPIFWSLCKLQRPVGCTSSHFAPKDTAVRMVVGVGFCVLFKLFYAQCAHDANQTAGSR